MISINAGEFSDISSIDFKDLLELLGVVQRDGVVWRPCGKTLKKPGFCGGPGCRLPGFGS